MKNLIKRRLSRGLVAALGLPLQALACDFPAGFFYRLSIDPGTLFVGRDAPIGTVIRPFSASYEWQHTNPDLIACRQVTRFDVTSPMPQIHGSPLVGPGEVILQTRIDGIGVVLAASYGYPMGQAHYWQFIPGQGRSGWGVPHVEIITGTSSSYPFVRPVRYYYRIIKTGPVDADMGPQSLAGHTLAEFTSDRHGKVVDIVFSAGTIDISRCGLPGAPGIQVSVPMGTWRTGQFKGQGSVTDAKAFKVPLQACLAGTEPGNYNYAVLRLDPRNGSSVLDAQRGILGLNRDSDATGVGVQVLKADLSPMPLTQEVQMQRLENGDVSIDMAARYIQLGSAAPTGGIANASVGFVLSYH